ncbi:pyruvate, phosphate dikinase [bacterium]|nr:pyruvate, phosphate dikinase [candidate division CSSED10-310 bacterium]
MSTCDENGDTRKYVYYFGDGKAEGNATMKNLLGGKGANLAEMVNLNIPVPPGFTISTEVCNLYYQCGRSLPQGLEQQVEAALSRVEEVMQCAYGDRNNPLLVSVRSGARVSMPGMMDTVLNLGLNDETIEGLIGKTQNERFAFDSYRRLIQMYSNVVMKMDGEILEDLLEEKKKVLGIERDTDLKAQDLKELVQVFKGKVRQITGRAFPTDPKEQLWGAIRAVFDSWETPRAITYRKINHIPEAWGTAVNVQAMVFGNLGDNSATGVAFTRDPASGKKLFFGEFLKNAQGEDVVAGIRTPQPINREGKKDESQQSLEEAFPTLYRELEEIYQRLEKNYRDMQDLEFTIQNGKLWLLQTRSGKRTGFAAIRIAVEMVEEGLITPEVAILRVEPNHLPHLLAPIFDNKEKQIAVEEGRLLARGLAAGPGAACGKVVFHAEEAVQMKEDDPGIQLILVRVETSPEDLAGMHVASGVLTARGGMTSHAAVVARGMGKSCVVGCDELDVDYDQERLYVKGKSFSKGDYLSIDGYTGEVIEGRLETHPSEVMQVLAQKTMQPEESAIFQRFAKLMEWADSFRKLKVRANADKESDAQIAVALGAQGIGLCRTEHMFFSDDRISVMREMIMARNKSEREAALRHLLPMQKEDFKRIFIAMNGRPVTIRTLDPPLHEFLPKKEELTEALTDAKIKLLRAADLKTVNDFLTKVRELETLLDHVEKLHEFNPMLGLRGCRLGIIYPEITIMQVRAIFEAACEVKEMGIDVEPEIMIPLVSHIRELVEQRRIVDEVGKEVQTRYGLKLPYKVGTMIELPRAAITADQIAVQAEFFSFGTNDLTQTTFGFSRDDAGKFLRFYTDQGVLEHDPFVSIDREGVGALMRLGVEGGRKTRPDIKLGICGEHGGDPLSIQLCHEMNLDYVSCSPFRIPGARLAAAQAAVKDNK